MPFIPTAPARLLLLASALSLVSSGQSALKWIPLSASGIEVNGLPWSAENGGELFRLPVKQKDTYRKPVWELA